MMTTMTAAVQHLVSVDHTRPTRSWSTPVWLRAVSVLLATGAVAAGITGGVAVLARQHATDRALSTARPLVVDAVTVDVALADANTTVAGGFLGAPPVPTPVQQHYSGDLATASSALTAAGRQAGGDERAAKYLTILSTGLPEYSATVATAEADYREGFPVAAAYLSEANFVMRSQLLPAATSLEGVEQSRLAHDDSGAMAAGAVALSLGLLIAVLVLAVWTQIKVSRSFKRLINVGLGITTVLVLIVGAWTVVATESASRSVTAAERKGAAPLATLTKARILAQQARADDELALVTRNSDSQFAADFETTAGSLNSLFAAVHPNWTPAEAHEQAAASGAWDSYHGELAIRFAKSDSAQQQSPVAVTSQTGAAQEAVSVDQALGRAEADSVATFDSNARAAGSDLEGLALGGLILMILAGLASVVGLEPRIREYR
jgi:hypothetical protein